MSVRSVFSIALLALVGSALPAQPLSPEAGQRLLRGYTRDVAGEQGLHDDTIDVIATDHAPHHKDEKSGEFDNAPPGISGLETSIGLSMRLVDDNVLTLSRLVEKMSCAPASILGLAGSSAVSRPAGIKGTLMPGADADLVIIKVEEDYTVNAAGFRSKGKNTPFDGWTLKARPAATIAKGRIYTWQ